jgi:glycosyltransferase involved in cell wall biosynthesis
LFAGGTRAPQTAGLAAALARGGFTVSALNAPHLVERVRDQYGQPVDNLAFEDRRFRGNDRVIGVQRLEAWWNCHGLCRCIERRGIDVIHVNDLYSGEQLERLLWLDESAPPIVATAWGSDVDDSAMVKHPEYPSLRRALLEKAVLVTAWSDAMARRCRSFVPERSERDFRVVRWYPDRGLFNPDRAAAGRSAWRQRLGIPSDALVVISPRNTAPNYRVDRIVRAFAAALAAGGEMERAFLVVVTSCGRSPQHAEYVDALRELAAPIASRVRFVEQVAHKETPDLFGVADVAVSIPAADGGPSTHFELIALGVPLIAGDLEDYQGILSAGENALVVDARNDEAVSRAIHAALTDSALRGRLRAGATASAATFGTFADVVGQYVEAYREAIARASHKSMHGSCVADKDTDEAAVAGSVLQA